MNNILLISPEINLYYKFIYYRLNKEFIYDEFHSEFNKKIEFNSARQNHIIIFDDINSDTHIMAQLIFEKNDLLVDICLDGLSLGKLTFFIDNKEIFKNVDILGHIKISNLSLIDNEIKICETSKVDKCIYKFISKIPCVIELPDDYDFKKIRLFDKKNNILKFIKL
jgi:hypothetical protein